MRKRATEFWKWMRIIRCFESSAKELYRAGGIKGALHLSIGQEAVPVGVCAALRDDDKVLSTHRSHGHYIGKTHDVDGAYAELLGRATGCSRGCGGSMHMFHKAFSAATGSSARASRWRWGRPLPRNIGKPTDWARPFSATAPPIRGRCMRRSILPRSKNCRFWRSAKTTPWRRPR